LAVIYEFAMRTAKTALHQVNVVVKQMQNEMRDSNKPIKFGMLR
jgi:hypothetical protein